MPAAEHEHTPPQVRRQLITVPVQSGAVRTARLEVSDALTKFGIAADSSLAGAALLVASELVTNVVRHAAESSPTAGVGVTVGDGQLVIDVTDQSARLPALEGNAMGDGLRTVAELAAHYDGKVHVERARDGRGKMILVHFMLPDSDGG
ncbi:ATP-binding protein [Streptomyces celluloflavus]|uniref:ATP-binding protein n=1 Tax=Streptomyces celluloflavus TaxID=58344 RepID=UPI00345F7F6F|nr:ATP-binding protein [Streptomyces celluloflavus]